VAYPYTNARASIGHQKKEVSTMRHTITNRDQQRVLPRVEELEDRQLLSVTVTPGHINLKSAGHGHGVFTVRVVNDGTTATTNLINAGSSLTVDVVSSSGTDTPLGAPLSSKATGDGLQLKFSRSVLKTLPSGTYTVKVSDGTAADDETGTVTLFNPGEGHAHHGQGHHDHGNGHGHGHHSHGSHGHKG
jgi:hypothetical protein